MCYVILPEKLKKKEDIVSRYYSRNKSENRGDGFIKGTPDYVLKYDKEIGDYYYKATHTPDGKPLL